MRTWTAGPAYARSDGAARGIAASAPGVASVGAGGQGASGLRGQVSLSRRIRGSTPGAYVGKGCDSDSRRCATGAGASNCSSGRQEAGTAQRKAATPNGWKEKEVTRDPASIRPRGRCYTRNDPRRGARERDAGVRPRRWFRYGERGNRIEFGRGYEESSWFG